MYLSMKPQTDYSTITHALIKFLLKVQGYTRNPYKFYVLSRRQDMCTYQQIYRYGILNKPIGQWLTFHVQR